MTVARSEVTPNTASREASGSRDATPPVQLSDPGWSEATWNGAEPAPTPRKSALARIGGFVRLFSFALVTLLLLPPFFIARALGRRWDRVVAGLWCGAGMALCGVRARAVGDYVKDGGAMLANHASWMDILVVGWLAPVHFVAKAEVAGWPLFGWIGRISNTVFIERRRTEAKTQERHLAARAQAGDVLCLFPEGTSTDGLRVLPFKSSLFSMFFMDKSEGDATPTIAPQPVTIAYRSPPGLSDSFYGWWGKRSLFGHVWDVACLSRGGVATVIFHEPLDLAIYADRKSLAAAAHKRVADGLAEAMGEAGPRDQAHFGSKATI